ALGAVNGLLLTGSRVCASLGADHPIFSWLGRWDRERGAPSPALFTLGAVSLAMVVAIGTEPGQATLDSWFVAAGPGNVGWAGRGGFETLLKCTAPIFWWFFLLTGLSLFALRGEASRDRDRGRPFPVPLFPVVPLLFCTICSYMIYSSIGYAGKLGLTGA